MAIQETRAAWQMIRSGHKQAMERIVNEVKAGEIPTDVAFVDIQGLTEQAITGSRAESLYRHSMISKETYEAIKDIK